MAGEEIVSRVAAAPMPPSPGVVVVMETMGVGVVMEPIGVGVVMGTMAHSAGNELASAHLAMAMPANAAGPDGNAPAVIMA